MIEHVLTKEQAERLARPELAGKIVMVDALYNDDPGFPVKERVAKNVFYNKQRIAGNLCLDE